MIHRKPQGERETIQEPVSTPVPSREISNFSYEDAYRLRAAIRIFASDMMTDDLNTSRLQANARFLGMPGTFMDSLTDDELIQIGLITNAYHLNNAERNTRFRKKAFITLGLCAAAVISFITFSITSSFHLPLVAKFAVSLISNILVFLSSSTAVTFIFEFVRMYRRESVIENNALIDLTNRLIEEKERRSR